MRILILAFALFSIIACGKDYVELNDAEIVDYLEDNTITATKTESGLYYSIITEVSVTKPDETDQVKVNYVGTLLDGSEFDSGNSVQFPLNGVISGWTEGLQLIGEGGKISLLIPSHLAYGANSPSPDIPSNSVLLFDVELLEIVE